MGLVWGTGRFCAKIWHSVFDEDGMANVTDSELSTVGTTDYCLRYTVRAEDFTTMSTMVLKE